MNIAPDLMTHRARGCPFIANVTLSNQYLTRRPTGDLKVRSPGFRDIETG